VRGISGASDLTEELLELKIGVFHPPFLQKHFGGSVAVTVPIVNALAESGHDVVLFAANDIDQGKIKEMLGTKISPLVKTIVKTSILPPRSLLDVYGTAFGLLALKKKCDITIDTYSNYVFPWTDICYIHFPYITASFFRQRFPYLRKRKGCWQDALNIPYIFFERNFESYGKKLILANSRFTSKATKESLGANAEVLYPPISTEFFPRSPQILNNDLRQNLVVTIGRITPYKRMETIPQIANAVEQEDARFVIIGFAHDEGTLRIINAQTRKFNLEGKVTILKDVSRERVRNILGKAKVYLHPPTVEHFGISIAEAMAMGCLPVVYNDGGVKEFVPSQCRYETLLQAADKIETALQKWTPNEAKKMTKIAEQFSESNFSRNFMELFSLYVEDQKLRFQ